MPICHWQLKARDQTSLGSANVVHVELTARVLAARMCRSPTRLVKNARAVGLVDGRANSAWQPGQVPVHV